MHIRRGSQAAEIIEFLAGYFCRCRYDPLSLTLFLQIVLVIILLYLFSDSLAESVAARDFDTRVYEFGALCNEPDRRAVIADLGSGAEPAISAVELSKQSCLGSGFPFPGPRFFYIFDC
jgi:hypothetical protein